MDLACDVLAAQHAEIRSTLTRAITDRSIDIFGVRAAASRFSVDVANHLASEAGSGVLLRGSTPERLIREAVFSLVCTTTPEMKTHLLDESVRRYDPCHLSSRAGRHRMMEDSKSVDPTRHQ